MKLYFKKIPVYFICLFLLSLSSYGKIFTLKRKASVVDLGAILNAQIDTELLTLENSVNQGFPDADASNYLSGMANSGLMSAKGLGADYTNDFSIFSVGLKFGVGLDLGENSFSDILSGSIDSSQLRGFGVQPALTFGLNLGILPFWPKLKWMDWDRLRLLSNFFFFDLDSLGGGFGGEISTFGMRLSYEIMKNKNLDKLGLVKWGGITVQAGFEVMKLKLTMTQNISEAETVTIVLPTDTINFSGDAIIDVETSSFSIPIEVSTNIRLLYALTFYGGFGLDINSAEATGSAKVTNIATSVNINGTNYADALEMNFDIGQNGKGDTFYARGFAGLQFNISIVKFVVNVQKSFNAGVWGANLGMNIVW